MVLIVRLLVSSTRDGTLMQLARSAPRAREGIAHAILTGDGDMARATRARGNCRLAQVRQPVAALAYDPPI